MKKILICCLMELGAIATQSFNVSNYVDMKPLIPNVPFNMYTEGELPTPWGFPGHDDNEVLMTIVNNTSCKITLNQWFAWKNIIGDDFEENFKKLSINPKSTEAITYGDVRRLTNNDILEITNSIAQFHVDGWKEFINHGVTNILYTGDGACKCVLVRFDPNRRILTFDPC